MTRETLFLIIVAFIRPPSESTTYAGNLKCQNGFELLGFNCYVYVPSDVTYQRAVDSCKSYNGTLGSKLVEPRYFADDRDIQSLIQTKNINHSFWIGTNDRLKEGTFRWESNGKENSYSKPDNGNSDENDCVERVQKELHSKPCSEKSHYVCEVDPLESSKYTSPNSHGDSCDNDFGCPGEMQCRLINYTRQCRCRTYRKPSGDQCLKHHGDGCSEDEECDTGMGCNSRQCRCDDNKYFYEGQCLVRKSYEDNCAEDQDCAPGMRCIWSNYIKRCLCNTNRYVSGSKCLLRKFHGDDCTMNEECDNALECRHNGSHQQCLCSGTEYFFDSICVPRKQYGGICNQDVECINGTKCLKLPKDDKRKCRFDQSQLLNGRCYHTQDCIGELECKNLVCRPKNVPKTKLTIIIGVTAFMAFVVGILLIIWKTEPRCCLKFREESEDDVTVVETKKAEKDGHGTDIEMTESFGKKRISRQALSILESWFEEPKWEPVPIPVSVVFTEEKQSALVKETNIPSRAVDDDSVYARLDMIAAAREKSANLQ